jgi:electron transport complex protein RnfE
MDELKNTNTEQILIETAKNDHNDSHNSYKEYFSILYKGIFSNNPVLVKAFALAPVLFVSTTLKNGLLLSVATFIVLCFMSVFSSLLYEKIPEYLRAAVITLVASAFVTGVAILCNQFAPNVTAAVGMFIPLIAVNGIIVARADVFQSKSRFLPSLLDGVANGAGFAVAIVILSILREVIGYGTLYEKKLPGLTNFGFDFVNHAPGAFLVLAVILALVQYVRIKKAKNKKVVK